MALTGKTRAHQIINRASGIFDSKQKELLWDMIDALDATSGETITLQAGTSADVPEGGGPVNIVVSDDGNGVWTLNLTPTAE